MSFVTPLSTIYQLHRENQKHTSYITNIFIKQLESNTSLHFREWKLSNIGGDEFYLPGYMQIKLQTVYHTRGGSRISSQGGALKKIVGVFRVKNHDFAPKKSYFSNLRGRTAPVAPPGSAPAYHFWIALSVFSNVYIR